MTGPISRNQDKLPHPIAALLDAARRDDLRAMSSEIDFAVSGVGPMVRALWDVDALDRDAVARAGLADLEAAGERPDLAGDLLEKVHCALAGAAHVRVASGPEAERALAALRVPDLPSGLASETRARLEALGARNNRVGDVYEAVAQDRAPLLLVVLPDAHRVALPPT